MSTAARVPPHELLESSSRGRSTSAGALSTSRRWRSRSTSMSAAFEMLSSVFSLISIATDLVRLDSRSDGIASAISAAKASMATSADLAAIPSRRLLSGVRITRPVLDVGRASFRISCCRSCRQAAWDQCFAAARRLWAILREASITALAWGFGAPSVTRISFCSMTSSVASSGNLSLADEPELGETQCGRLLLDDTHDLLAAGKWHHVPGGDGAVVEQLIADGLRHAAGLRDEDDADRLRGDRRARTSSRSRR